MTTSSAIAFITSLAVTVMLAPAARRFASRLSLHSRSEHTSDAVAVPLLGGVALAFGTVAGLLSGQPGDLLLPLLTGSLVMCAVGLARDFWPLRSATLATGRLVTALVIVNILPRPQIAGGPVADTLLAVVWIGAMTTALAALERRTSLALGAAAAAAVASLLSGGSAMPVTVGRPLVAVAGSAVGLLLYRAVFRPVAVGQAGAAFLGAWLAIAAIAAPDPVRQMTASAVPIFLGLIVAIGSSLGRDSGRRTGPSPARLTEGGYEVWMDFVLIATSYYAAFLVRFGDSPQFQQFFQSFARSLPTVLGCQLAALLAVGKYRRLRFVPGATEIWTIMKGVTAGVVSAIVLLLYAYRFEGFSRQVFAVHAAVMTVLLITYPIMIGGVGHRSNPRSSARRVLIYGAGRAGALLVRELNQNDMWNMVPLGFIDDDVSKRMLTLDDVAVLGTVRDLPAVLLRHDVAEVLVSMKDLPSEQLNAVAQICREHGVALRRLRWTLEDIDTTAL